MLFGAWMTVIRHFPLDAFVLPSDWLILTLPSSNLTNEGNESSQSEQEKNDKERFRR